MINQMRISGSLQTSGISDTGTLSLINRVLSGSSSLPKYVDASMVHCDTSEAWNSSRNLVAKNGHIYIYSDYNIIENDDGSETKIPGIKIGDGTSYLIDMPFVFTGTDRKDITAHMNDMEKHVSVEDRDNWNEKVKPEVIGENLFFMTN